MAMLIEIQGGYGSGREVPIGDDSLCEKGSAVRRCCDYDTAQNFVQRGYGLPGFPSFQRLAWKAVRYVSVLIRAMWRFPAGA